MEARGRAGTAQINCQQDARKWQGSPTVCKDCSWQSCSDSDPRYHSRKALPDSAPYVLEPGSHGAPGRQRHGAMWPRLLSEWEKIEVQRP